MSLRLKKVEDQVIVITGATSGIGLTTARLAAQRGAKVVLVARDADGLHELTEEIHQAGGSAEYVVADVGNQESIWTIATIAVERFGGFDTWVNNAGVGIYGGFLDVSMTDQRRLFDTNFWGIVYGSVEAARHFRQRGGDFAGAIINIGSEVSDRAVPIIGMYAASKHAVKGFTDAFRMDLEKAGEPISVTLIKPAAIDTPFPQHAKNYMKEEPELPAPLYTPDVVAEVILHCAETPERDMFAGGSAALHSFEGGVFPRLMDWLMEAIFFDKQKSNRPADHSNEALYSPTIGLRQRGSAAGHVRTSSVYSQAAMHPLVAGAVVLGASLAVAALLAQATGTGRRG